MGQWMQQKTYHFIYNEGLLCNDMGQWMQQKTYHFIYNEGFCNAHFLLSEKNDECW